MEWSDWLVLLTNGGVIYLIADRFFRTKEQKGIDAASMMQKMNEACSRTLETVTEYLQKTIANMRSDRDKDHEQYLALERRYDQQEARYDRLEKRFEDSEADRELLKTIVNGAVNCSFLKSGNNKDCPVIKANQKRLAVRCKTCKSEEKKS